MFAPRNKYLWWRFKPENVDWVGVGLDAGGIVFDVLSGGVGGRVTNAAKFAKWTKRISRVDLSYGLITTDFNALAAGRESIWEVAGLATDVAGLAFPIVPDLFGLGFNFVNAGALHWTP